MKIKLATVFSILIINLSSAQCAMCRAVLESNGDTATAEGINNGITYLMVIPYILVAIVGYQIYKGRK